MKSFKNFILFDPVNLLLEIGFNKIILNANKF